MTFYCTTQPITKPRHISDIARDISEHWSNVYFGARPYLQAMYYLSTIEDYYGLDTATTIIYYFLANASTWRGKDARRIKAELKAML